MPVRHLMPGGHGLFPKAKAEQCFAIGARLPNCSVRGRGLTSDTSSRGHAPLIDLGADSRPCRSSPIIARRRVDGAGHGQSCQRPTRNVLAVLMASLLILANGQSALTISFVAARDEVFQWLAFIVSIVVGNTAATGPNAAAERLNKRMRHS